MTPLGVVPAIELDAHSFTNSWDTIQCHKFQWWVAESESTVSSICNRIKMQNYGKQWPIDRLPRIDSPDFIVGSHTNPLWDRAILLQFFGQYALNSERLVGSLHNRNGFSLFIAILMDDDWDKFEWNREKSGPRNFYQPLWQLQVNERGCKNVCCRLVGSLRTKSIWQLRQWQTSCVLAAAMQCARFSFDSKWATWNVRTRRFVQICNRWMGYANYAIR